MVMMYNWPLLQFDVNNVLDLFEEIFMELPLGYKPQTSHNHSHKLVCKLKKLTYSLKQASRQWYEKFSDALIALGFSQSKADYSFVCAWKRRTLHCPISLC